jgi:type IV pilus assembly protein PilM
MRWARHTAIGIDIGNRTLKAAQLSYRRSGLRVSALAICPRVKPDGPVDQEEIRHIQGVLRRQGFSGSKVVLAVADGQLLRGILQLPPTVPAAAVSQMARMELARIHHIEPQGFELVCWAPPTSQEAGRSNMQTVAVACPHAVAQPLLEDFERAGLDVIALDARTAAAARACRTLAAPGTEVTAILDLGWSTTKLLLVCGETVIYERLLKSDLTVLTSALAKRFKITQAAASQLVDTLGVASRQAPGQFDDDTRLALQDLLRHYGQTMMEELKVPFAYARQYHVEGVRRLLLLGGGASLAELADVLSASPEIKVLRAAPRDVLGCDEAIVTKSDNPALTVAVGLAMFGRE